LEGQRFKHLWKGWPMSVRLTISTRMRPVLLGLLISTLVSNTIAGTLPQQRLSSLPASPTTFAADDFKLDDNKPSERTLGGGDSHAYKIKLKAGQYLKVIIEQIGIDVTVAAITPVGSQAIEVNSLPGMSAAEIVELISDSSGTYSILVRP